MNNKNSKHKGSQSSSTPITTVWHHWYKQIANIQMERSDNGKQTKKNPLNF